MLADQQRFYIETNAHFIPAPAKCKKKIPFLTDGLRMTKAGIIKAKFSRRPRNVWKLKRVTVDRTRFGKYYAYILYEYAVKEPEPVVPAPETTLAGNTPCGISARRTTTRLPIRLSG